MIRFFKALTIFSVILFFPFSGIKAQISGGKTENAPADETGAGENSQSSAAENSGEGISPVESTDIESQGITEEQSGNAGNDYFNSLPSLDNKNLFESINDLSICNIGDVRNYITQYLNNARPFTVNAIIRCNRYHSIVLEIFKEHNIPVELSYLPLLESGFNPWAVSRSKAVGIWQFMRFTAKEIGLKSNEWVEERMDIEKSTLAAILHLKHLYRMFNSWDLALASYNGGAGYIRAAMIKTRTSSFEALHKSGYLKNETCQFVHRYAALTAIYNNQERFGLKKELPEKQEIRTSNIILESAVNLRDISGLLGISMEIIRLYNPELKRNITPPYEKNYTLRLPEEALAAFEINKSKLYANKFNNVKRHIVKKGENLSRIAVMYNMRTRMIAEFNDIKNPALIQPGQAIYIPL